MEFAIGRSVDVPKSFGTARVAVAKSLGVLVPSAVLRSPKIDIRFLNVPKMPVLRAEGFVSAAADLEVVVVNLLIGIEADGFGSSRAEAGTPRSDCVRGSAAGLAATGGATLTGAARGVA